MHPESKFCPRRVYKLIKMAKSPLAKAILINCWNTKLCHANKFFINIYSISIGFLHSPTIQSSISSTELPKNNNSPSVKQ